MTSDIHSQPWRFKTASSMLGHYDAGFTLNTHAHATSKTQEEAVEKLGIFMTQVM